MSGKFVRHGGKIVLFFALLFAGPAIQANESADNYLDLPLQDLLSMEVTSVAKKRQRLNEAAAAVFVISQEDIHRSGATSIPEALRMAPGIQVARIDANKWAISSRGFNNQFANKLLVMIDGRTVYTPAYSGVYWDAQDTLMEDIDRIEVIRGPGASVWGANAVNGVINIITRQSSQTQGGLLVAGAGSEEKAFASLRFGSEIGQDVYARAYLKFNDHDSLYSPEREAGAGDDWRSLRGGFRIDGQAGEDDSWTLQGDAYGADENQVINLWKDPTDPANGKYAPFYLDANRADSIDSNGWNLLGKWNRRLTDQASTTLQIYYDHTERTEALISQVHDTLDIDFQHQFSMLQNHGVTWGVGYRYIEDNFDNSFMVSIQPDSQEINLYSAFVQDEIELIQDRLRLTIGSKFEHNGYTGFEVQPSIRLIWLPNERNSLWTAVSRAVRTPSRLERDSQAVAAIIPLPPTFTPVTFNTTGNNNFRSETLLAYEAGYRFQPRENIAFDLSLFYNEYDYLQAFEQTATPPPLGSLVFDNSLSADSYGIEITMDWRPLEWWRLQSNYSFIQISDFNQSFTIVGNGSTPKHQFSLRSAMDLSHNTALDLWVYYTDQLETTINVRPTPVDAYTSLNIRFAWQPQDNLELSIAGQNLLQKHHLEFVGEDLFNPTEIERSVYGKVRWDF